MMKFTVDDSKFKARIEKSLKKDSKELLAKIGQDMLTNVDFRFRQEKDPEGKKWEQLSEVTLERRRKGKKKSKSTKIGQVTGLMRGSFKDKQSKESVEVGTSLKRAKTFHYGAKKRSYRGGKSPWGDVPSRKIVGFSKKQFNLYRKWIKEFYNE